ncbi:DedA family protein [Pseudalkalibacillus decolorationis]|uniref:DedA family protein n=1 Tax=Pseudalkalibacillus decolorationis TaxID=163879 RepID=UPI0021471F12|nr:VTT domain-containing protein [Pseudalkalibacillus decolorationis]
MVHFIIDILKDFGMWGLFTSMAIEASSLPFPGVLVSLLYGYLLDPSWIELITLSLSASFIYTVFSFIPYLIGYKLEDKLKEKLNRNKVEKAQKWFQKFGSWTIAVARPFGIGNYVSYAAGVSQVKVLTFGALTFIGIFPLTFVMLWLGRSGNVKSVHQFMSNSQTFLLIALVLGILGYVGLKIRKRKLNKSAKYKEVEQHG